jgi:acetolactate synthase-1/2/3 large subunit
VELLLAARRPVLFAGGGVTMSGASEHILALAERLDLPVTNSLMGLGSFPGTHPLFLGMLGMHGLYQANLAVQEADLLVAVGARFDDRVTGRLDKFARAAKIIQIDVDPTSIHKRINTDVPLVADARQGLSAILDLLGENPAYDQDARRLWLDQIAAWRDEGALDYRQAGDPESIRPQMVIETLYEKTRFLDPIITTDVGQHQMWAAQYFLYDRPRRFITSGGLGVMGFGLPAALGAQVARPEALVIDIAGDGSILMNIQEMVTIVEEKLPVKVAVINNGCLGMVRQWQELFYDRCYADTILGRGPDFVRLAEAFGARGVRAARPEEVGPAIEAALDTPGPVVMEFIVSQEALVYPMVAAGSDIGDMLPFGPGRAKARSGG